MPSKQPKKRAVTGSSSKQELHKSLSVLRGQLTKTENALNKAKTRGDRWRLEAKAQRRTASRALAQVEKLRRKLDAVSVAPEPVQAEAPLDVADAAAPVSEPATGVPVPDETWSVVQLRAEARARGLTGMSNKTKAQLLAALS